MSARTFLSVLLVIAALATPRLMAAEPAPRLNDSRDANGPTHVIALGTAYYTTGPQQGRPADGKFAAGTKVRLLEMTGSYALIQTLNGITAYIAADVMKPLAPAKPLVISDDVRAAAKSGNTFAFDLYGQLRGGDGNLFFSPASISTAMAMTSAGAAGETRRQMAEVLRLNLPEERLHAAYGTLGQVLNAGTAGYQLRMANRLWAAEEYPFQQSFLTLAREAYGAELSPLDFNRSEEARQTINSWVEQQTNDRIQDLIPEHLLTPDTRLVLTNAIYFKANWVAEFKKRATRDEPFHLAGGGEVAVPLMRQTRKFRYAEAAGLQALELPYVGNDLSMVVLLPKRVGLADLERSLTAENVERWMSGLRRREVELSLPRFKTEGRLGLGKTLSTMGMPLAFSDDADFSRMSSAEKLKLSEVIHKAFIDVNEQGTEAAAATAVVAETAAAVADDEEPPVVFRADRPFVFLIRDHRTGVVLFLGRVVDPSL